MKKQVSTGTKQSLARVVSRRHGFSNKQSTMELKVLCTTMAIIHCEYRTKKKRIANFKNINTNQTADLLTPVRCARVGY